MVTDRGAEILMHIGINTVEMNGEGFVKKVKDGQKVKAGDVLIEFDIEKIKKAGYDTTTIMVISNTEDYSDVKVLNLGKVKQNNDILIIRQGNKNQ